MTARKHALLLRPVLFLLVMMLAIPSGARAQIGNNLPDAAYIQIEGSQSTENKNPLHFNISPDSATCNRVHGNNWYGKCQIYNRNLRLSGKKAESGITITPAIKGEWRWTTDYNLEFRPAAHWQAGQSYRIAFDLDAMNVPPFMVFGDHSRIRTLTVKANDLTFAVKPVTYMQDPDDAARKVVSAHITANYPTDSQSLQKNIRLTYEEGNGKNLTARDGGTNFEFTADPDKNGAWLAVPVTTLPDAAQYLTIIVQAGLLPLHGGTPAPKDAKGRTRIPTRDSYLALQDPSIAFTRKNDGTPVQTLSFTTNVTVRPSAVREHLKLYILPAQHPVSALRQTADGGIAPYQWRAENEVTPEILAQSTAIAIGQMDDGESHTTQLRFPIDVPAGRYAYLTASAELPAFGGYILGRPLNRIMAVPAWPNDIAIMQQGSILTLSGNRKLSLHARGTDKLTLEIAHIRTAALQHFISQTEGNITSPRFSRWNFNAQDIAVIDNQTLPMNYKNAHEAQYTAFDFTPYLKDGRKGLFLVRINGWRNDQRAGDTINRFVLVTDMGLVVKQGRKNTRDLYLMSFAKGQPVSGASVSVLGRNGLPVFTGETDADGHLALPALDDRQNDRTPVAIIAEKGEDFTFIPFEREDRILNMSQFETGGTTMPAEGLNAYLFSDRGIYRPGETAQLGAVVRNADWSPLPAALPLQIIIADPRGRTIHDEVVDFGTGLHAFTLPTATTSPTGTYRAYVHIPGTPYPGTMLGSTSFRVEDFQPDRLKIATRFKPAAPQGWLKPEELHAELTLTNLYGTAATGRRVTAAVTLNPATLSFAAYKDYKFHDSYAAVARTIEYDLPEATTDGQGRTTLALNIDKQAPHTYSLNLQTTGYESGSGRGVTAYSTALVSPMDYVVGYKTDANLSYLRQGQDYALSLQALDPALQPFAATALTREIVRVTRIATLTRRPNGSYAYENVPHEEIIDSAGYDLPAGGDIVTLPTAQTGQYRYRLRDADKRTVLNIAYAVIGTGATNDNPDREAALDLRLDKDHYETGEDIEIAITAPYVGAGLITIETDHVITHKWFRTDKHETVQKIAVPDDLSGKAYLSVAFVRDINARDIYMTPLSHATIPFTANVKSRTAAITLSAPDLTAPGEPVTITYKGDHAGKAIIYAVDEGILQVARYKTPDPVNFFLLDRALQVRTAQMLDLLMPEYDIVRALSAVGGDAQAESAALGKHLNPFQRKTLAPAIFWSGIVDLAPEEKTVTFTPPGHFNGQMRLMAVAVTPAGVGSTAQDITVRAPIVLTPNTPLFMAPGDKSIVSLTVANNTGTDATLALSFTATAGLHIDDAPQDITVRDGQESTIRFAVRATDHLGSASLTATATFGAITQSAEATLSIRPATPRETTLTVGYAEKGDAKINLSRVMFPQLAERDLALSPLPSSYIHGLARYLEHFPYGCTEQVISRALPQLALHDRPEFSALTAQGAEKIDDAIATLRQRQTFEGGFPLWGYGETSDPYATAYALDFLLTAADKGHKVPQQLLEDGLRYLRDSVNMDIDSPAAAYNAGYGIYVLTRAGIVTSNEILNLLKYYETSKTKNWQTTLPAAYIAAAYKLMQQSDLADETMKVFIAGLSVDDMKLAHNKDQWDNPFVKHARAITLLARHFPEQAKTLDRTIIFRLATFVQDRAYNTLSAAYAIEALTAWDAVTGAQIADASFTVMADKEPLALRDDLTAPLPVTTKDLTIKAKKREPVFYTVTESGFDRAAPAKAVNENIEIERHYKTASGETLSGPVTVGDTVITEIIIRTHGNYNLANIALVDLLPGGFDLESSADDVVSTFAAAFTERREDRIIAFGTVLTEPRVLRYRMRAVMAGTYTVPAPFAEALYDVTTKSRGTAAEITVIDAP